MKKGPVSGFIEHHYRHFNAAALMDAAKGYESHLLEGGKMMITLAGAMMGCSSETVSARMPLTTRETRHTARTST